MKLSSLNLRELGPRSGSRLQLFNKLQLGCCGDRHSGFFLQRTAALLNQRDLCQFNPSGSDFSTELRILPQGLRPSNASPSCRMALPPMQREMLNSSSNTKSQTPRHRHTATIGGYWRQTRLGQVISEKKCLQLHWSRFSQEARQKASAKTTHQF